MHELAQASVPFAGASAGGSLCKPIVPGTVTAKGCPRPTGRITARSLGPARLGWTRRRTQRVMNRPFSTRGRSYWDFFCLNRSGIRVGYASPTLLASLSRSQRLRVRGRAVIALTANPHYTLHGIALRSRIAADARKLHTGRPFHVGLNYWYLAPFGRGRAVLKVRGGVVQEIGIADRQLTRTRSMCWRFLKSFS